MAPIHRLDQSFDREYRYLRLPVPCYCGSVEFDPVIFSLRSGWCGMLGGVLSGAVIGLFFLKSGWLGGYGSRPRRLVRLGHISFFGIGLLNLFFALSLGPLALPPESARWGSLALLLALLTMPTCCFLTAWKPPCRHLFPIPVLGAATGIVILLAHMF